MLDNIKTAIGWMDNFLRASESAKCLVEWILILILVGGMVGGFVDVTSPATKEVPFEVWVVLDDEQPHNDWTLT